MCIRGNVVARERLSECKRERWRKGMAGFVWLINGWHINVYICRAYANVSFTYILSIYIS